MDKIIKQHYTDPKHSGAYAGVETLYQNVHRAHPEITRRDVQRFLQADRTYTLFKPRRINFARLKTVPFGFLSGTTIWYIHLAHLPTI